MQGETYSEETEETKRKALKIKLSASEAVNTKLPLLNL